MEDIHDKLRKDCWDKALHSFAISYLFGIRQKKLRQKLTVVTFLGIITPLLVGAIVSSYGAESNIFNWAIWILTPISIFQLVISTWSLVAKWNDTSEYLTESIISNSSLSEKYQQLAKFPPENSGNLKTEFDMINIENSQREQQDNKYPLTEKEQRRGMRFALRQFERKCVGCEQIPRSMESSDCPVCGKF